MEQVFTHIEKRQSKISSNRLHQSLIASRSSPTTIDAERLAYKNLSPASVEGSGPSHVQSEILKAGHVPEGHWRTCLCRTKDQSLSLRPGKISTQDGKPGIGYVGSLSYVAKLGLKGCVHRTAFANTYFKQLTYTICGGEFLLLQETSVFTIKAFHWLDEAHPHYGGQSALFPLKMLITF